MLKLAPVLIPTLNRHIHFKNCVESLSLCIDSDETDLFIALDYPLNETHREGYDIINNYIKEIKGFKSVNVFKRNTNYGIRKNINEGRSTIFKTYDRLIFSEDDNIFGKSFLKFMNKGLDVYKDREDIFSISGYNYPYPIPDWYKEDVYLKVAYSAWGVGTWRHKWEKVDWSINNFNKMFSKRENFSQIKKSYKIALSQLYKIRDTGIITGDGLLFLYLLDKKMYSVFPIKSLVRNTGHDGSGENCTEGENSHIYMEQSFYQGSDEVDFLPNLTYNIELQKYFKEQIKLPLKYKLSLYLPKTLRIWIKKIFNSI